MCLATAALACLLRGTIGPPLGWSALAIAVTAVVIYTMRLDLLDRAVPPTLRGELPDWLALDGWSGPRTRFPR